MTGQAPVACSLSGGEATVRAAQLAQMGERSLVSSSVFKDSAVLKFTIDAKDEIAAVVSAESACCPFFTFEVVETDTHIDVRVSATEDAGLAVKELVAVLEADRIAA